MLHSKLRVKISAVAFLVACQPRSLPLSQGSRFRIKLWEWGEGRSLHRRKDFELVAGPQGSWDIWLQIWRSTTAFELRLRYLLLSIAVRGILVDTCKCYNFDVLMLMMFIYCKFSDFKSGHPGCENNTYFRHGEGDGCTSVNCWGRHFFSSEVSELGPEGGRTIF